MPHCWKSHVSAHISLGISECNGHVQNSYYQCIVSNAIVEYCSFVLVENALIFIRQYKRILNTLRAIYTI